MNKLLKTKCFTCKGQLFVGKFWIEGFSDKKWCSKQCWAVSRLKYLRKELEAERISYGELAELQSLKEYIHPNDIELLQAIGVPEFENEDEENLRIKESISIAKWGQPYKDLLKGKH